jgi:hypothetical protein
MPFDKLYIKIICFACKGTRVYEHSGHHNPYKRFMWKSCPYCDEKGLNLIEAHHSAIAEYLKQLPADIRDLIIKEVNKDGEEEG